MAKMIIDIPDAVIDDIKATYEGLDVVYNAVKFGKVLPKNATNGDIIKVLFPYIDKNFSNVMDLKMWWNAKYKAGDTE